MNTPAEFLDLRGMHALVTGASGGVGAEICKRLLVSGVDVLATDIDERGLSELESHVDGGGRLVTVPADLSEPTAAKHLAQTATANDLKLRILINNAALFVREPLGEVTTEGFDKAMAVNVRTPIFLIQELLPAMVAAGGGVVVNVASVAVRTGGAIDVLSYTASKGALVAATKSIAKSVAARNVRVNALLPAAIDTPMLRGGFTSAQVEEVTAQVPLGRLADPSEIAAVVCWLCSSESSYITGASIDVNGGWVMT
ncbi:MAG: SDR family NAD(P)-dependent oxidoreductase [Acidimicrobiia bacterium]